MLPHFLHLLHKPSGMSRLRDLAPASLGFLIKLVVWVSEEGGVTAGSATSRPRVFLLNDVVAMSFRTARLNLSSTAFAIKKNYLPIVKLRVRPSKHTNRPRRPGAKPARRRWSSRPS